MSLSRQGHQSPRLKLEAIADLLPRSHKIWLSDVQELEHILGEVKELCFNVARGLMAMMKLEEA